MSSSPVLVAGRALIDSLGYIDTEYNDPVVQQTVAHLIRAEMTTFAPSASYLDYLPDYTPRFAGHARLQSEYKRVAAKVPLDAIDLNRYQAKAPTGKQAEDVEAWETALKRLRVQVEHQGNRVTNLELQQAYGAKLCKVRAAVLEGVTAQYASVLQQERSAGETVNVKRKQDQLLNVAKLQTYRRKYEDLLTKNDAIENACAQLEAKKPRTD